MGRGQIAKAHAAWRKLGTQKHGELVADDVPGLLAVVGGHEVGMVLIVELQALSVSIHHQRQGAAAHLAVNFESRGCRKGTYTQIIQMRQF